MMKKNNNKNKIVEGPSRPVKRMKTVGSMATCQKYTAKKNYFIPRNEVTENMCIHSYCFTEDSDDLCILYAELTDFRFDPVIRQIMIQMSSSDITHIEICIDRDTGEQWIVCEEDKEFALLCKFRDLLSEGLSKENAVEVLLMEHIDDDILSKAIRISADTPSISIKKAFLILLEGLESFYGSIE